jgi:hypothetical protein
MTATSEIMIRLLEEADAPRAIRLARLDSAPSPVGALLGAEIEGELIAVRSLSTGESVADPFRRTAEAVQLLELRATQLDGNGSRGRRLFLRGRRRSERDRGRAALAGSPPGAGGRLLNLGGVASR